MRIEDVELFYLAMPTIRDMGDGSQDALLIRVRSDDGLIGWGESEASPLVSIANFICPMSHSACKNVHSSIIGRKLEAPIDIIELGHDVRANGLDIAQTDHTWSGVEIALWDLLGKKLEEPVYRLLGYETAFPKTPYASQLFGATPAETYEKAKRTTDDGFCAVKFGWGNYGQTTSQFDRDQVVAAREGIGDDGILLIDAGTVWREDVDAARQRLAALEEQKVLWLEEPFIGEAVHAYRELAKSCQTVKLAGGEGASNFFAARHLIDHGQIGFVQIDAGRIGGIGPAQAVAEYATARGVTFVNHTFTTHLALSASLAPFAGIESAQICEYPVEASELATQLTTSKIDRLNGVIRTPEQPGLGIEPDASAVRKYLVDVELTVAGRKLYSTPSV